MSLPLPHAPEPTAQSIARDDDAHHFAGVHGDVAALHARIEQSFAQFGNLAPPVSPTMDTVERLVQGLSRASGFVTLGVALALLGYVLI